MQVPFVADEDHARAFLRAYRPERNIIKSNKDAAMDYSMWKRAVTVIPDVTKEEWDRLDLVSRWLISSRAAVLLMTFFSAALAGLFAWRDGSFRAAEWVALTLGLILAHAANNIFNDYTDFVRGVDTDNYYRTAYGTQPLARGLMSRRQHLTYFAVTGLVALAVGFFLVLANPQDPILWALLGSGTFFVLFYTWPLKRLALGEVSVLIVWGPLMVGGGYYVVTGQWSWAVVTASLPYVFGVTAVIFGKHIDKLRDDRARRIYTLPVLIGERWARRLTVGLMIGGYVVTLILVASGYFSPVMLVVLFALPTLRLVAQAFRQPKPESAPEGFPQWQGGWPLFFAPLAFVHNRRFGSLFIVGLIADVCLHLARSV